MICQRWFNFRHQKFLEDNIYVTYLTKFVLKISFIYLKTLNKYLVTFRFTLLMETGLLHDYFGNFSMQGKKFYFHVEVSIPGEIEPMQGEIDMNIGKLRNLVKTQISFLGGCDLW